MKQVHPIPPPAVSVVIPVYNLEDYLDACLESVEGQSFADFEAIVVNDGSTDRSEEKLRLHALRDPRIEVVTVTNRGVSLARAAGIARARGKYICFLDGDDIWMPDMLSRMVEAIEEDGGYDIVCCNYKRICPTYEAPVRERRTGVMQGLDFLEATLCHTISVTVWGKLYRSTLFADGLNHYPLRLGQDSLLNIQIGCRLPRVRFIDYVGYGYVQRADSSNHRNFDIAYCRLFCEAVERELTQHERVLGDRTEFYALLNKLRWYQVYIRKCSSQWAGSSDFALHVYALADRYRADLRARYSRWSLFLLDMYRFQWLKPAVAMVATLMRWNSSLQRRLAR